MISIVLLAVLVARSADCGHDDDWKFDLTAHDETMEELEAAGCGPEDCDKCNMPKPGGDEDFFRSHCEGVEDDEGTHPCAWIKKEEETEGRCAKKAEAGEEEMVQQEDEVVVPNTAADVGLTGQPADAEEEEEVETDTEDMVIDPEVLPMTEAVKEELEHVMVTTNAENVTVHVAEPEVEKMVTDHEATAQDDLPALPKADVVSAGKAPPCECDPCANVNCVSQGCMDSIEGLGRPTAKAIIAGRPYTDVADFEKKFSALTVGKSKKPNGAAIWNAKGKNGVGGHVKNGQLCVVPLA